MNNLRDQIEQIKQNGYCKLSQFRIFLRNNEFEGIDFKKGYEHLATSARECIPSTPKSEE